MIAEPKDLKVVSVDFKLEENGKIHKTDQYDVMDKRSLVVRRGEEFNIGILLNRAYDKTKDDLKLVFYTGTYESVSHWLLIHCRML